MALPTRPMHVPAGLPIDESTRVELLDVGRANRAAVNVRQDTRGALNKRLGFGSLVRARLDATSRNAGHVLLSHNDLVCTVDGTHLDAYAEDKAVSVVASRVPEASVTTRTVAGSVDNAASLYDAALCNGYLVTASLQADTLNIIATVETTSGVVARSPETVHAPGGVSAVQLATYGVYVLLIVAASSSANVPAYYLDTTSAATITTGWVSIGNVATDKITTGLALSAQGLTDRVAFAYVNDSAGASRATVKTVTIAGVVETATVNTASATPAVVTVEGSAADTLWVAWDETVNIRIRGLTATALGTVRATTATICLVNTSLSTSTGDIFIVSSATATKGRIAVQDGDGRNLQFRDFQTTAGAAATDGPQNTARGLRLDMRPFQLAGRYYGLFRSGDANNGVAVLCDWTDMTTDMTRWARPVATAFPGLAHSVGRHGMHHIAISATKVAYVMAVQRSAIGDSVELVTYDFADAKRWRSISHNGSLVLASGILSSFDGRRVAEVSYLHSPRKPTVALSVAGGPDGTNYRYVCTFEEMDDDGNWCVSGVSAPSDVISPTNQSVSVGTDPLTITNRQRPAPVSADRLLRVAVYRTLTNGEAPYYFVGSQVNFTSVGVLYSDTSTDATIRVNRLLYGTGSLPGINGSGQDRRAPPYCADIVSYAGMLVAASGTSLWWSGQTVDGEGTWFSPAFQVPVEGPGPITALAAQDGTLVVFKRRSIYTVSGEAPSDNGYQGGLGTPRRLACDVGCIDPRSVLATSLGIFFQSDRGLELLSRSGGVTWIGESVQATLATYPIITSAVLDDHHGLVRFTLAASQSGGLVTGAGRTLVFDLAISTWVSTDDVRGVVASQAAQSAAQVYLSGAWRYAWLGVDGTVYSERSSTAVDAHLDGANFVVSQYEIPPWKLGLQQEQRIYEMELLFQRHSAAGLTIEIASDYGAYVAADEKVWSEAVIVGQNQVSFRPNPRGNSVQARVRDTAPAVLGTGRGLTFVGLSADIAPKQGPTRATTRISPELRR